MNNGGEDERLVGSSGFWAFFVTLNCTGSILFTWAYLGSDSKIQVGTGVQLRLQAHKVSLDSTDKHWIEMRTSPSCPSLILKLEFEGLGTSTPRNQQKNSKTQPKQSFSLVYDGVSVTQAGLKPAVRRRPSLNFYSHCHAIRLLK